MEQLLAGSAIGIIGALTGAVLALWWRGKYNKAEGKVKLVSLRLMIEEKEHDQTLARAEADAEKFEEAERRKDERIAYYRERVQVLRTRRNESASLDDLHDIANELFPVPEADEGGNEVAHEDGDSAGTVSDETGPTATAAPSNVLKMRDESVLPGQDESG